MRSFTAIVFIFALVCCSVGALYIGADNGNSDQLQDDEDVILFDATGGSYTDPETGKTTHFDTFREANDADLDVEINITGDVTVTDQNLISLKKTVRVLEGVTLTADFPLEVPSGMKLYIEEDASLSLLKDMILGGNVYNDGSLVTQKAKITGDGRVRWNPVTVLPYLSVGETVTFCSGTGKVTHEESSDTADYDENAMVTLTLRVKSVPEGCGDWDDFGTMEIESVTFSSASTLIYIPSFSIGKVDVFSTSYFSYYKVTSVSDAALAEINARIVDVIRPQALSGVEWGATVTVNPETYYTDPDGVKVYYQVDETSTCYYNGFAGYGIYAYGDAHDIRYLERGHVTRTEPESSDYATKVVNWCDADMVCSDRWVSGSITDADMIGGVMTYTLDFECDVPGIEYSVTTLDVATNAVVSIGDDTLTVNQLTVTVSGVPEFYAFNWGIKSGDAVTGDMTLTGSISPTEMTVDGIRYGVVSDTKVEVLPLSSGYYESSNLVIPKTIDFDGTTYTVVGIGDDAFSGCLNVYAYTIKADITYIGEYAFRNNQISGGIVIPASVESIGENAFDGQTITSINLEDTKITEVSDYQFRNTSLTSVVLPDTVTRVGNNAFSGITSLTSVTLNEGLAKLDAYAFGRVSLDRIVIPASVCGDEAIDEDAFGSAMIKEFVVAEGNTDYISVGGAIYTRSAAGTPEWLWFYPIGSEAESFTVDERALGLEGYCMYGAKNIKEVIVDNSMEIGEYSMAMSSVTKLTVTSKKALPEGYDGVIAKYFGQNYWSVSNITIGQLSVSDVTETLSLEHVSAELRGSSYSKIINIRAGTDTSKITVGAQQFKDGSGEYITVLAAGARYTSDGTTFDFDDARLINVTVLPDKSGSVAGDLKVKIGTEARLTAEPIEGFVPSYWLYNGEKYTGNVLTFTMGEDDVDVTVVFEVTVNVVITVPQGYTLTVMTMTDHSDVLSEGLGYPASNYMYYRMFPQQPVSVTPSGTDNVYEFALIADSGERCMFVVTDGEKTCITYKYIFVKNFGKNLEFAVTEEQLNPAGWTETTVDRSLSDGTTVGGDDVGGLLASINPQNFLVMQKGTEKSIFMYREWQIIQNSMSNRNLEPDFHYRLISLDGSDPERIIEITDDAVLTWKITAKSNGTVIVAAWSDAVTANFGSKDRTYGASWPELSSVFVITVNDTGTAPSFDTGLTVTDNGKTRSLDQEVDYCYYYMHTAGYYYTMTPAEGTSVEVYNPVFDECSVIGFVKGESERSGDSWTVLLTEGRNIVKFTNGGEVRYHIITAIPFDVEITNGSGDGPFNPGDTVTITFHNAHNPDIGGIYNSKGKLFGIYNSNATIYYLDPDGERVPTARQPMYGHYFFLTQDGYQTLTVTLPDDWDPESGYVITGGHVLLAGYDGSGTHRDWFSTTSSLGIKYASFLPDITIANSVKVSFDVQGHGTAPAAQTVDLGGKASKPADPAAEEYIFGGWFMNAGCTRPWDFASDTVIGDITLYAKWTAVTYTVTFDVQGHGTAPEPQEVVKGGKVDRPADPTAAGVIFDGWFKDAACTDVWDFENDTVPGQITLYAKWATAKHSVLIAEGDNGTVDNKGVYSIAEGDPISVSGKVMTIGVYTFTATPDQGTTTVSYSFFGWIWEGGSPPETVTGDMTITAVFMATVTPQKDDEGNTTVNAEDEGDSAVEAKIPAGTKTLSVTGSGYAVSVPDASSLSGSTVTVAVEPMDNPSSKVSGKAYEFTFEKNGSAFTGKMSVTLPFQPVKGKTAAVYFVDGDNVQKMNVTGSGRDGVTFETEHNSVYVVTYEDEVQSVGSTTILVICAVIVAIVAIVPAVFLRNRNRSA